MSAAGLSETNGQERPTMADDFDVFDFALTDDEMARIASLENGASAFFDHRTADSAARFDSMRQG